MLVAESAEMYLRIAGCTDLACTRRVDKSRLLTRRTRIEPSIEAARFFGGVYEFWGDTLEMDIKFLALDSTEVRDSVP